MVSSLSAAREQRSTKPPAYLHSELAKLGGTGGPDQDSRDRMQDGHLEGNRALDKQHQEKQVSKE